MLKIISYLSYLKMVSKPALKVNRKPSRFWRDGLDWHMVQEKISTG